VGQLAAGIAHEINTPVQYVDNSLEFLDSAFESLLEPCDAADLDYLRASVPESLTSAREGVARIARIVGAMRAFSHPDGRDQAPADLNEAIKSSLAVAVNEYRYLADIVLDLAPLPHVTCHLGEINQVILNLIVNAAHAIDDAAGGTG